MLSRKSLEICQCPVCPCSVFILKENTDQNSYEIGVSCFPVFIRVLAILCLMTFDNNSIVSIIISVINMLPWPGHSLISLIWTWCLLGQWLSNGNAHQTYLWSFIKIQRSGPYSWISLLAILGIFLVYYVLWSLCYISRFFLHKIMFLHFNESGIFECKLNHYP